MNQLWVRKWLSRILIVLMVIWLLISLWDAIDYRLPTIGYNVHFLRYHLGLARCGFRKTPLVQLVDEGTVAITWETNCKMRNSQFRWRILDHHETFSKPFGRYSIGRETTVDEHSISYDAFERLEIESGYHLYRVIVKTGAMNGKWCEYQVQLATGALPHVGIFPLLPPLDETRSLSVAILGDSQNGMLIFNRLLKLSLRQKRDLFIHLGDMVQRAFSQMDWETCYWLPMSKWVKEHPIIMVPGNHDVILGERTEYFGPVGNVTEMMEEDWGRDYMRKHAYHAVSIGPIRWISLDSNEESDEQVHWLEQELQSVACQRAPFRILLLHIPPFIEYWDPIAWNTEGESKWPIYGRTRLVPLFEKYRVDLVLSGHQHNYQRGYRNGVHYLISGGAGGQLDRHQVEQTGVYRHTFLDHHYLILDATKDAIRLHCYDLKDHPIDSLEIPRSTIRKIKAVAE